MTKTDKKHAETARPAYHHGDLRRALIDATRELVESKGPDHFSVAEAARLAGVSSAAPYKHFAHRDEMLLAVVMDTMDVHYEEMRSALEPLPERSLARIEKLGQLYIAFATQSPNLFRLVFGLAASHGHFEPAVEKGRRTFGLVQQEVAAILGHDTITQEVERRAMMLWSFVHGLSFLLIDGKVASMGLDVDLDALLRDIGLRVIGEVRPPNA